MRRSVYEMQSVTVPLMHGVTLPKSTKKKPRETATDLHSQLSPTPPQVC